MQTAIDILEVLRAMRQSNTAMRVCVNAHSTNQPLEWRMGELEFARQELQTQISHIEECIDIQCRLHPNVRELTLTELLNIAKTSTK